MEIGTFPGMITIASSGFLSNIPRANICAATSNEFSM
jgi:hypothetical protein